jgi:hypothetical protein
MSTVRRTALLAARKLLDDLDQAFARDDIHAARETRRLLGVVLEELSMPEPDAGGESPTFTSAQPDFTRW